VQTHSLVRVCCISEFNTYSVSLFGPEISRACIFNFPVAPGELIINGDGIGQKQGMSRYGRHHGAFRDCNVLYCIECEPNQTLVYTAPSFLSGFTRTSLPFGFKLISRKFSCCCDSRSYNVRRTV